MNRSELIKERQDVIAKFTREENQCFFGPGGMHEYDQAGFDAAQASAMQKKFLKGKLNRLNKQLGLPEDSRDPIE